MTYTKEHISEKISKELEATHINVEDLSDGCGMKFSCFVVSAKFEGKPLLQRHRMVNAILEEELKTVHALTMKTLTPEQFQKQQAS